MGIKIIKWMSEMTVEFMQRPEAFLKKKKDKTLWQVCIIDAQRGCGWLEWPRGHVAQRKYKDRPLSAREVEMIT